MILYRLRCKEEHEFDGWFRNGATFDAQRESGALECPVCGTATVSKALMAPSIASGRHASEPLSAEASGSDTQAGEIQAGETHANEIQAVHPVMRQVAELKRQLRAMRRLVEENCDYVGDRFADEARRIHYGESEANGIYGETTPEESERLREEGIEFGSMPWIRDDA
jgi:hypothetical protein